MTNPKLDTTVDSVQIRSRDPRLFVVLNASRKGDAVLQSCQDYLRLPLESERLDNGELMTDAVIELLDRLLRTRGSNAIGILTDVDEGEIVAGIGIECVGISQRPCHFGSDHLVLLIHVLNVSCSQGVDRLRPHYSSELIDHVAAWDVNRCCGKSKSGGGRGLRVSVGHSVRCAGVQYDVAELSIDECCLEIRS